MKNLKSIITVGIAVLFIIIVVNVYSAITENNDYARLTEIDYTAEVVDTLNSRGKVRITERLTFDIHAASKGNLFWELWRDLPEEYVEGVKVEYEVLSVKRISVDGKPAPLTFKEASKLYWYDEDYVSTSEGLGPNRWYHSKGSYDGEYRFECVLLYVDGLYRETSVYEIEYEMYNASMRYADCSELHLSIYSGETIKYLNSAKAQILFPNNLMPNQDEYIANTFGTNSHTFPFTHSDTLNQGYHTFMFNLNKDDLKFKPYNQYIEFSLVSFGQSKHSFTQFASTNDYYYENVYDGILQAQKEYFDLPAKYLTQKITLLITVTIIMALLFVAIIMFDKKYKTRYNLFDPEVPYEYFREIPGELDKNLAGALVFCKHKLSDEVPGAFAATMLSLVRKNYIDVQRVNPNREWTSTNTKIIVKQVSTDQKPLTTTEELYFNLIRRHALAKGQIELNAFQQRIAEDYQFTNSFVSSTKSATKSRGVAQGFFQKPQYKAPKINAATLAVVTVIIGFLILLFGNIASYSTRMDLAFGAYFVLGFGLIISALLTYLLSKKYVLLTQFGETEYAKWRGLYNFLNSETLLNEKTVLDVQLWEDYLIYATAFGISEKVIKALHVRVPDYTNLSTSTIISHPYLCHHSFIRVYGNSFRTSTRTATWTSRVGTGTGGGYGGGGRGGGGGGGGH